MMHLSVDITGQVIDNNLHILASMTRVWGKECLVDYPWA